MGLIERIAGLEAPKIAAHQFCAALGELQRVKTTRAEIIAFFGVVTAEEADLDLIIAKIVPIPDSYAMGGYTVLTALGTAYDATAQQKGLGFVAIEGSGLSSVEFRPRFNKIGTGTLSLQLWDETVAFELVLITDAVVGDNKAPSGSFTAASPVTPGIHIVRVRALNSTAAQAPVYYGSSIIVSRKAVLPSKVLEEVCVLAEVIYPTVDTAAKIRARFGI